MSSGATIALDESHAPSLEPPGSCVTPPHRTRGQSIWLGRARRGRAGKRSERRNGVDEDERPGDGQRRAAGSSTTARRRTGSRRCRAADEQPERWLVKLEVEAWTPQRGGLKAGCGSGRGDGALTGPPRRWKPWSGRHPRQGRDRPGAQSPRRDRPAVDDQQTDFAVDRPEPDGPETIAKVTSRRPPSESAVVFGAEGDIGCVLL